MKIKPLIIATLLTSSVFGTQAFAKELAVCYLDDYAPHLFSKISCQDTTKPLQNGLSDSYETTLYQLYKQGWKIVATQGTITTKTKYNGSSSTETSSVRIYLEK